MKQINISIPKYENILGILDISSDDKIKTWFDALPLTNIGQVSGRIFNTLHDLNRSKEKEKNRYTFLGFVKETVEYITDNKKTHYINVGFPLAEKGQKVAKFVYTLYAEIAVGYKIIVREQIKKGILTRNNKMFYHAIYYALYYLHQQCLVHYSIYSQIDSSLWKDIYQLYALAEELKLQHKKIKAVNNEEKFNTIEQLFITIVMLSFSNPYRLTQKELFTLSEKLSRWSNLVSIEPLQRRLEKFPEYTFIIDLNSHLAVPHLNISNSDIKKCRVISTENISKTLKTFITKKNTDKQLALLPDTLQRLLFQWEKNPGADNRTTERIIKNRKVKVILGLYDIFFYVDNQKNQEWIKTPLKIDNSSESPEGITEEMSAMIDEELEKPSSHKWEFFVESGSAHIDKPTTELPDISLAIAPQEDEQSDDAVELMGSIPIWVTDKVPKAPPNQSSIIVDEHHKGCRLNWGSADSANVLVGRLVGISKEDDPSNSSVLIGHICWIRQINNTLEVGIEWLATCFTALTLRINSQDNDIKGLILLGDLRSGSPYTLLLDARYANDGMLLEMNMEGENRKVILEEQLRCSEFFVHYCYSYKEEKKERPKDKNTPEKDRLDTEDNTDFKSIWSKI